MRACTDATSITFSPFSKNRLVASCRRYELQL